MKIYITLSFLIFLFNLPLITPIDPKTWSTQEILSYINNTSKDNLSTAFIDPEGRIYDKTDLSKLTSVLQSILTYSVNTYILLIYRENSTSFNLTTIIDSYTYPPNASKGRSLWLYYKAIDQAYKLIPGDDIKNIYTDQCIEKIFSQVNMKKMFGIDYGDVKIILSGIRNALFVPDGGWTPLNLVEYYNKSADLNKKYIFFDPCLETDVCTDKDAGKYLNELANKNIYTYYVIINEMNEKYKNVSSFLSELVNIFPFYNSNKDNSLLVLSMQQKDKAQNDIFIGKNNQYFGQTEYDELRKSGSCDLYSSDICAVNLVRKIKMIFFEYTGWTADQLFDYLNETKRYDMKLSFFYYFKDSSNMTSDQYDIIKDRIIDLSNNKLYFYMFYIYKMDVSYNKNITAFAKEFINLHSQLLDYDINNVSYNFFSILDGNLSYLEIGNNHKKIITNEIINQINKETIDILNNKTIDDKYRYINIIGNLLRIFRYEYIIKPYDYTPNSLAAYIADYIGKPNYLTFDQNNFLTDKQKDLFTKYYISINNFNNTDNNSNYVYTFLLNKIDQNYSENMEQFVEELITKLSYDYKPTKKIGKTIIVVLFYLPKNKFFIDMGKFVRYLNYDEIKKILNVVNNNSTSIDNLLSNCILILKYLRYYTIIEPFDWTGRTLAYFFNDIIGEPKHYLFDTSRLLMDNKEALLNSYLNLMENQKNIYGFQFIIQKKNIDYYLKNDNEFYFINELADSVNVSVDKNECFFIGIFSNKTIQYNIGSELQLKLPKEKIDSYSEECIKYMNQVNETIDINSYYTVSKCLLNDIRNDCLDYYKTDVWTASKLMDYIKSNILIKNKNNVLSLLDEYSHLILDLYFALTGDEEDMITSDYLEQFFNNNKTHSYIFILNKVESNYSSSFDFLNELYSIIDTSSTESNKENILLFLYLKTSNILSIYPGKKTKNILTINNLNTIINKNQQMLMQNFSQGLISILSSINTSININPIWNGADIKKYMDQYEQKPDYILFDIFNNLNKENYTYLQDQMQNITKNETYIFTFIMGYILNDMNYYLNDITKNYPIPKSIKSEINIFIIYCTDSNDIGIKVLNDDNNLLNQTVIDEIIKEGKNKPNIFDCLTYIYGRIKYYLVDVRDKKGNKGNNVFKILSFSLIGFIIVVFIIVLIWRCYIKKSWNGRNKGDKNDINERMSNNICSVTQINNLDNILE